MARILIAEDDQLISSFVEKGLRANGFATSVAEDGEEAERLSLTDEFDLMILDMGLPHRDGYDVLRRRNDEPNVLNAGQVRLDLRSRRASVGDQNVDLTGREFALLETFMRHADQVLSREQLLSHVWGYHFDPCTNVVNVYVSVLRRKLGERVIETVRGYGYRLSVDKEVLTPL